MAANLNVPRPQKCLIKNLDGGPDLTAYFNPKELSVDKTVPWNKHKTSKGDNPTLEFTALGQAFDCSSWTTTDDVGALVTPDTALNYVPGQDAGLLTIYEDNGGN